jgi:hypothetical protein
MSADWRMKLGRGIDIHAYLAFRGMSLLYLTELEEYDQIEKGISVLGRGQEGMIDYYACMMDGLDHMQRNKYDQKK